MRGLLIVALLLLVGIDLLQVDAQFNLIKVCYLTRNVLSCSDTFFKTWTTYRTFIWRRVVPGIRANAFVFLGNKTKEIALLHRGTVTHGIKFDAYIVQCQNVLLLSLVFPNNWLEAIPVPMRLLSNCTAVSTNLNKVYSVSKTKIAGSLLFSYIL